MRGKDDEGRLKLRHVGITPAYAGKRRQTGNQNHDAEDHPRVCGEKCFAISAALSEKGSPPRMRGKERILQARATKTRITPAYAGKSLHSTLVFCNRWDHPRVCGEKAHHSAPALCRSGSPPHMRGKVTVFCCAVGAHGITPAHAGKSGTVGRSTEHRYPWKLCGIPAAHGCPRVPAAAA